MADFVTLRFDRKSVESLNLHAPLFALEQLIVSAAAVRDFAGRVRITFEGYDEVSEVFMDPSVQRFVRELTDLFPYWLHFADKDDDTLRLLLSCLLPPRGVEVGTCGEHSFECNVATWSEQVTRLHRYMTRLHVQFALTEQEAVEITQSVLAWSNRIGLIDVDRQLKG